jgi:hypothetical protein
MPSLKEAVTEADDDDEDGGGTATRRLANLEAQKTR